MYRILIAIILVFSILTCAKDNENDRVYTFTAVVSAFDRNCEICVLEFPDDSLIVRQLLGEIPYNNLYNAINLNMDDFEIGENLIVTIRKPQVDEMKACKTLYASYTNQNIFVIKYKLK